MPLATMIPACRQFPELVNITQEPRYSDLVDLQLKIEPIVKTVGYGSSLAGDMLKSEMAAQDLIPFVSKGSELLREF